jgi:hypothetical protein
VESWTSQNDADPAMNSLKRLSAARVTARFAIEKRLNAAKQRRQQAKLFREARAASFNRAQRLRSKHIFEKKAREDCSNTSFSFELRRSNEQLVLQRQVGKSVNKFCIFVMRLKYVSQ